MRNAFYHILFLLSIFSLIVPSDLSAKRIKLTLKTYKDKSKEKGKTKSNNDATDIICNHDSTGIMIADASTVQIVHFNESDSLLFNPADISFAGYDKEASSSIESFLIINDSPVTLTGTTVRIIYKDMKQRMLHSRDYDIKCLIPSKQTRKIDIPTWDKQKTYYYYLGNKPKKIATPYNVSIVPVSYTLEKE